MKTYDHQTQIYPWDSRPELSPARVPFSLVQPFPLPRRGDQVARAQLGFGKTLLRAGSRGFIGALAFLAAAALSAAEPASRPIQTASSLETTIPPSLAPLLLQNPAVRFQITVNEEGKLVDFLATDATHHELLPRAEQVLQQAVFTSATDQGGKPVTGSTEAVVSFYDPEQRAYQSGLIAAPFGSNPADSASRRFYTFTRDHYVYRRVEIPELDKPVEMRATKVTVLLDDKGQPPAGACLIEFFIDAHGEVRMPRVVSTDNEKVSLSALLTLKQTHFAPITRGEGVRAYVRVRQPMSFAAPADAKPAPAAK